MPRQGSAVQWSQGPWPESAKSWGARGRVGRWPPASGLRAWGAGEPSSAWSEATNLVSLRSRGRFLRDWLSVWLSKPRPSGRLGSFAIPSRRSSGVEQRFRKTKDLLCIRKARFRPFCPAVFHHPDTLALMKRPAWLILPRQGLTHGDASATTLRGECNLPKVEVAGSIPVSRCQSLNSNTNRQFQRKLKST